MLGDEKSHHYMHCYNMCNPESIIPASFSRRVPEVRRNSIHYKHFEQQSQGTCAFGSMQSALRNSRKPPVALPVEGQSEHTEAGIVPVRSLMCRYILTIIRE
mmetsp:Transcript_15867/g.45578  ORF Transcript_15867/g.45578 Transcript_15867/m.45578 type:complete len:102 (-) Transcript_15867:1697-2002(-)